jgi:hypothetical protein
MQVDPCQFCLQRHGAPPFWHEVEHRDGHIVTYENVDQVIDELLDLLFWPKRLDTQVVYRAQTDDTDGSPIYGVLSVVLGPDGDAWVRISQSSCVVDDVRFRTFAGGGQHLKVRNAIMILALAMLAEEGK